MTLMCHSTSPFGQSDGSRDFLMYRSPFSRIWRKISIRVELSETLGGRGMVCSLLSILLLKSPEGGPREGSPQGASDLRISPPLKSRRQRTGWPSAASPVQESVESEESVSRYEKLWVDALGAGSGCLIASPMGSLLDFGEKWGRLSAERVVNGGSFGRDVVLV
ncbi:hypothetical protein B296_00026675 [Ensete ventricosum]|uniref:Uncharacterized protein n=1 Tax=Ensete ventricosum TaxID=4639 RepID=A0A426YKA5_ENSVE|nr:hypothetical protein B296_00026675 [Ensete ventricosum]